MSEVQLEGTVIVTGRHGPHCKELKKLKHPIISVNHHCKKCGTAIRVLGSPKTRLAGHKHNYLIAHAAWEGEELADSIWFLNPGTQFCHLYINDGGIINSFPYVPITGLVAIQFALFWGAEKVIVAGMDFFEGKTQLGPHYLPPQRDLLKELIESGHVEMFQKEEGAAAHA